MTILHQALVKAFNFRVRFQVARTISCIYSMHPFKKFVKRVTIVSMEQTVENRDVIAGNLLKQTDVALWPLDRFQDYFLFADFFYVGGKIVVTRETVAAAEQYQDASNFMWEMLTRIDRPLGEDWNMRQFYMRLSTILRTVKLTIEKYPDLISALTVQNNRNKVQYSWMNNLYDAGGKWKRPEIMPEVVPEKSVAVLPEATPVARLADAMGKVADVYYQLANSITIEEINAMSARDRIAALNKLSYIHTSMKKFKPSKVFVNINTNKEGKEKLEEALLNFDDDDSEEE